MPKVTWQKPKHQALSVLLFGTIFATGRDQGDVAAMIHKSEPTVSRRLRDPGSLTLDELLLIGRKLGIPIDDLRKSIQY